MLRRKLFNFSRRPNIWRHSRHIHSKVPMWRQITVTIKWRARGSRTTRAVRPYGLPYGRTRAKMVADNVCFETFRTSVSTFRAASSIFPPAITKRSPVSPVRVASRTVPLSARVVILLRLTRGRPVAKKYYGISQSRPHANVHACASYDLRTISESRKERKYGKIEKGTKR